MPNSWIPGIVDLQGHLDRLAAHLGVSVDEPAKLPVGGFDFQALMWPDVPQTEEEIEELKGRIYSSFFYGSFVWFDSKRTLISSDFFNTKLFLSDYFRVKICWIREGMILIIVICD